jgi:hypothetical protein
MTTEPFTALRVAFQESVVDSMDVDHQTHLQHTWGKSGERYVMTPITSFFVKDFKDILRSFLHALIVVNNVSSEVKKKGLLRMEESFFNKV